MKTMRAVLVFFLLLGLSTITPAQWAPQAADFSAVSMHGDQVNLSSLRGKVVLLTFWSSRCAICQNEIPKLNHLTGEYSGNDVVFLAATTENESIVTSYLRHQRFNFQILPNSFGLMLKYAKPDASGRVQIAYPAYYLIDRRGRIQYQDYGWDKSKPITEAIEKALLGR
jgi:peroxiredoxin